MSPSEFMLIFLLGCATPTWMKWWEHRRIFRQALQRLEESEVRVFELTERIRQGLRFSRSHPDWPQLQTEVRRYYELWNDCFAKGDTNSGLYRGPEARKEIPEFVIRALSRAHHAEHMKVEPGWVRTEYRNLDDLVERSAFGVARLLNGLRKHFREGDRVAEFTAPGTSPDRFYGVAIYRDGKQHRVFLNGYPSVELEITD